MKFVIFISMALLFDTYVSKVKKSRHQKIDKVSKSDLKKREKWLKQQRELDDGNSKCIPELLISYGFSMRTDPIPNAPLNLCTDVYNSCCSVKDQTVMYNSWILQEQESHLQEKFEWIQGIYKSMFDKLENVQKKAEDLHKALASKNVSNCQILSRRLTQMQISYVRPKLEEVLQYMYKFLIQSYKGIYCTVCDAQSHSFIDIQKKTITYSDEYCRETIIKTLHPMMYLHDFFNKYLNIVTKFMISCDHKGIFQDRPANPKFLFHSDYKHRNMLNTCNEQRNKVDWLESCEPICNEFQPSTFNSQFFAPNIKKFYEYTQFLEYNISIWDSKKTADAQQSRLLSEEGGDKNSTQDSLAKMQQLNASTVFNQNQWIKFEDDDVFSAGINALINLNDYTPVYKSKGINLSEKGRNTIITEDQYEKVKESIKTEKRKLVDEIKQRKLAMSGLGSVVVSGILFLLMQ